MPYGWIDRQMSHGRVLFMLDGLDETEPELRDRYVLPWFQDLYQRYPRCRYLVSSRPVGYPPGALRAFEFAECELLDFGENEIAEYTRHWCTAVRLARNEPGDEARREGAADGERIVAGFNGQPYIRHLARNPLMLSAICLVNYFEGGQLPKDRAVLYKLCVEGLLHHWDQRRGIHSDFGFDEKLRACREVALTMQADNLAEYEPVKVEAIFAAVLGDSARAGKLLEHIRRRTGLLLERRSGIFAFARLTFQEYLAARAVHEGNRLGIDAGQLVREHDDARWHEVIALYSGLAPAPAVREMVEHLFEQPDTPSLSNMLAEAYLMAGPDLAQDHALRQRVLERIAVAPAVKWPSTLERFPPDEVVRIANSLVGKTESEEAPSEAHQWLQTHPNFLDGPTLARRLRGWRHMKSIQVSELIFLLHAQGQDSVLRAMATDTVMYAAPGPQFTKSGLDYGSQAEIALIGLSSRADRGARASSPGVDAALLQILRTLSNAKYVRFGHTTVMSFIDLRFLMRSTTLRKDSATWPEFSSLARRLAERLVQMEAYDPEAKRRTIAGGKTPDGVSIGVAPEANLLVAGVLIGDTSLRTLVEGISWAVEKGADVISMSLGFSYYEPLFDEVFRILIEEYGILPVVAIGNENHGNSSSPGNVPNAFSVGAAEKIAGGKIDIAFFSSGASLVFPGGEPKALVTKPEVVAPGVQVDSCIPPEKRPDGVYEYTYMDGTSMATPHIAAVAALLMAAKPEAPVADIINVLKETARHPRGAERRPDNRWGYGFIQPAETLKALG